MKQRNKFFWLGINHKDGDDTEGGGSTSGGKDEGKDSGKETSPNPEFEKLVEGMEALGKGMEALQKGQADNATRLAELDATGADKQNADDADADKGGDDFLGGSSEDIERLSRTEFANKIIDRVVKAVDKQMKQVTEEVEGVRKDAGNTALENQIEKLEAKHKDFWDWQPEIKILAQENPGTSLQRLYAMAKHENPNKLAEMEKKYKKDDETGKGGDSSKSKNFGGLTPTSSAIEHTEKMDKTSAADKAFEETMGHFNMPAQGNN